MYTSVEQQIFNDAAYKLGTSHRLAYSLIKWRQRTHDMASSFEWVAQHMGVTVDRAKKACNDLRRAGLISIEYPWHEPAQLRITEVTKNAQG